MSGPRPLGTRHHGHGVVLRIGVRGAMFTALAAGTYFAAFSAGLAVVLLAHGHEAWVRALTLPSWLDVAAAACAALTVNVVPSSRLRLLPVWLACGALMLLRVYAFGAFVDVFAFGPGAYPQHVWANTLALLGSRQGLLVAGGVLLAGALAAVRRAPRVTY